MEDCEQSTQGKEHTGQSVTTNGGPGSLRGSSQPASTCTLPALPAACRRRTLAAARVARGWPKARIAPCHVCPTHRGPWIGPERPAAAWRQWRSAVSQPEGGTMYSAITANESPLVGGRGASSTPLLATEDRLLALADSGSFSRSGAPAIVSAGACTAPNAHRQPVCCRCRRRHRRRSVSQRTSSLTFCTLPCPCRPARRWQRAGPAARAGAPADGRPRPRRRGGAGRGGLRGGSSG